MIDNEELQMMLNFMEAAHEATENCYTAKFVCPICGKIARAAKSELNGHIHAYCNGCDSNFME